MLAVGPLFLACFAFGPTKRFAEGWVSKIANYSVLIFFLAAAAGICLSIYETFVNRFLADSAINNPLGDAFSLLALAGAINVLIIQLPGVAAGITGGAAISGAAAMAIPIRLNPWTTLRGRRACALGGCEIREFLNRPSLAWCMRESTQRGRSRLLSAVEGGANYEIRGAGKAPTDGESLLLPCFGKRDGRGVVSGAASVSGAFTVTNACYSEDGLGGGHLSWHEVRVLFGGSSSAHRG